jgi:transposase-like protein
MATKKSYRRYSPEFKREAIKRACEEGMTDAAVCKELGVTIQTRSDGQCQILYGRFRLF